MEASNQLGLFQGAAASASERSVLDALRRVDAQRTTPFDALTLLARLRAQLDEGER